MLNSDYMNDILDYADAHDVTVRIKEDGTIAWHANKKTPQAKRTGELLNRIATQNKGQYKGLLQETIRKRQAPPPSLLSDIGSTIGSGIDSLVPSTGAGQMAVGALAGLDLLAPEAGIPLTLGAGALGGALGTIGSDQSLLSGVETGVTSAAQQVGMSKALKGGKIAYAWLKRPHNLDLKLMSEFGGVAANAIQSITPKAASRIIKNVAEFGQKGKNTVIHVLNSGDANTELEQGWKQSHEAIADAVEHAAKDKADTLSKQIKVKYPKEQAGAGSASQFLDDVHAAKEAIEHAKTVRQTLMDAFDDIGGENYASFGPNHELKHSYAAWKMQNKTVPELEDRVQKELKEADPTGQLANMRAHTRDLYSKFKGLKDLVNMDNVTGGKNLGENLQPNNKWFEAGTLQKALHPQTNPSLYRLQRRLKDVYEPLKQVVRRNAPDMVKGEPVIADRKPFDLNALRMGESLPLVGRIYGHLPYPKQITRFIGDAGKTGGKAGLPKPGASHLPSLLNIPATSATEQIEPPNRSIIMPPEDDDASIP